MKTSGGSRQKSALQARLRAWDDAASQAVTRTGRKSRNWLLYTTAVGSALAMATDAGAQIVQYSGTPPAASLNVPAASFPGFDPFSVGPAVFSLAGNHRSGSFGAVGLAASVKAGLLTNGSNSVRKLSSGAKISSHGLLAGGLHTVKVATVFGLQFGSFSSGVPGFAGIEFNTGANPASASINNPTKIHYGWVELEFGGSPFPTSIEAISWAYNSVVGAPIMAGQTSADTTTPEPGTAALSLLALGAAGVLAWRRKKAALNTV